MCGQSLSVAFFWMFCFICFCAMRAPRLDCAQRSAAALLGGLCGADVCFVSVAGEVFSVEAGAFNEPHDGNRGVII